MLHGRTLIAGALLGAATCFLALETLKPAPKEPIPECLKGLVFSDAILSAGSTEYIFEGTQPAHLSIHIEHEATKHEGFDNLLAPATDGPAEANADQIGRTFSFCDFGSTTGTMRLFPLD